MIGGRRLDCAVVAALILLAGFGAVAGLETLIHHHEVVEGAAATGTASAPTACRDATAPGGDACAAAPGDPRFGVVLGLPVAAWATGAHATIVVLTWLFAVALATGGARLTGAALLALLSLAAVLLGGTVAYLYIGLDVLDVRCPLCLTMHGLGLGVVAIAAVALLRGRRALAAAIRAPSGWTAAAVALALWPAAAWGSDAWVAASRPGAPAAGGDDAAWSASFARACAPDACPAALLFDPGAMPRDDQSLVLANPPRAPVLVAQLDLACVACRAQHRVMGPRFRELVARGEAGLRLVLWSGDSACNPHVSGRGHGDCAANVGLVCAHRHGGADAALNYLDWELSAAAGYHTAAGRRRWLTLNVDRIAGRCFDAEISFGRSGTLGSHAAWGLATRRAAARTPACDPDAWDVAPWWCFDGTPAYGIFRATRPPKVDDAVDVSGADGTLRRLLIDRCLER